MNSNDSNTCQVRLTCGVETLSANNEAYLAFLELKANLII